MKTLFTIFTFVLSMNAQAGQGYSEFYSVAAESYVASPLCPTNAVCVTDGTVVDLEYRVNCTEEMVSFAYEAIEKDGDLHLYVNTVLGTNPSDGSSTCQSFSYVQKKVTLINQFGKVVLHELGVSAQSAQ